MNEDDLVFGDLEKCKIFTTYRFNVCKKFVEIYELIIDAEMCTIESYTKIMYFFMINCNVCMFDKYRFLFLKYRS